MTDPNEALAHAIGFTIGEQFRETQAFIPDPSVIGTHARLLRMMVYELGVQLNWAINAADRALEVADQQPVENFWREIQLLLTFSSTAASIIWTSPTRRKNLIKAFPSRMDDMKLLLQIKTERYDSVIALRDAVIHIDEKMEQWWIEHAGKLFGIRVMGDAAGDGTDFLTWTSETQTLTFFDKQVSVPSLRDELEDLRERSSRAFSYMIFMRDSEDYPATESD